MKDERITLETAKLAKAKNFNEFVQGSYTEYLVDKTDPEYPEGGGPFGMKKGEVEFDSSYIRNNDKNSDLTCKSYACYSAPTQSLLQRWLREIHNIQVYCYSHTKNGEGKYRDYVVYVNDNVLNDPRDEDYQTYEEALEVGLQFALEMI